MEAIQRGYFNQEKLAAEIEMIKRKLGPEVVRVRYSLGANHWDDPAIYFRIVITDAASKEEVLGDVTQEITRVFYDELRPLENWDLRPYFSFRNESEQAAREGIDLAWT